MEGLNAPSVRVPITALHERSTTLRTSRRYVAKPLWPPAQQSRFPCRRECSDSTVLLRENSHRVAVWFGSLVRSGGWAPDRSAAMAFTCIRRHRTCLSASYLPGLGAGARGRGPGAGARGPGSGPVRHNPQPDFSLKLAWGGGQPATPQPIVLRALGLAFFFFAELNFRPSTLRSGRKLVSGPRPFRVGGGK